MILDIVLSVKIDTFKYLKYTVHSTHVFPYITSKLEVRTLQVLGF